jgi:hypothetical protein
MPLVSRRHRRGNRIRRRRTRPQAAKRAFDQAARVSGPVPPPRAALHATRMFSSLLARSLGRLAPRLFGLGGPFVGLLENGLCLGFGVVTRGGDLLRQQLGSCFEPGLVRWFAHGSTLLATVAPWEVTRACTVLAKSASSMRRRRSTYRTVSSRSDAAASTAGALLTSARRRAKVALGHETMTAPMMLPSAAP